MVAGTVRAAWAADGKVKHDSSGIRHDYKEPSESTTGKRVQPWLMFVVGLFLPMLMLTLFVSWASQPSVPPSQIAIGPVSDLPLPIPAEHAEEPPIPIEPAAEINGTPLDLLVKPGDTLEILFRHNGLDLGDLAELVALPEVGGGLKLLKPGDRLEISHRDGQVLALKRELDEVKVLSISRGTSGFEASTLEREVSLRTTGAHGVIRSSLFEAGVEAGMSDKITMDMASIFEWDIDFIQDVREGDEFTIIYEELWRDGVKLRNGDIVAAEFVNQGRTYRAARFKDSTGRADYFTPDGRSVRKAFIRAPLNFTHISSNFNPNRRHPVLNTIRAHRGVDYAAPTGTPIRAAGDGKVVFRGTQGGYGNVVILQHGSNITTLYGHMSRFSSARVGSHVRQGDVIGYVGSTGFATGPHLHWAIYVNGLPVNPSQWVTGVPRCQSPTQTR